MFYDKAWEILTVVHGDDYFSAGSAENLRKLEEALKGVGFTQLDILRPSMLLGDREESRPGEFIGKLFMQPISFLIPWEYKPIHARTVAAKIRKLIKNGEAGVRTWSGKALFNKN